jgi:exonuclease III
MNNKHIRVLSWNVRGLNAVVHQDNVRKLVELEKSTIVCLQETKLKEVTESVIARIYAGRSVFTEFCFLSGG